MDALAHRPRNILVTGGAGFIGSHVASHLALTYPDYSVTVLDRLDYCASLCNLGPVLGRPNFRFVKGDIQAADLVLHVLQCYQIDTVLHFAAQTHVDNSFGNSLTFTANNVVGTHVLLEAARSCTGLARFINVSTDEVYGDESLGSLEGSGEGAVLEPTNPYSAAKAGAEMMCKAYLRSYGTPIIITRGNNVYGPGQYPEKLIPKLALLAAQGRPLPVHGDGSAIRSFLHIDDVVRAFDVILHRGRVGQVYNIGTRDEHTVAQVAHSIAVAFGRDPGESIAHVKDRVFNDRRYFIGCDKLLALGWRQLVAWQDGLRATLEWYRGRDCAAHWPGCNLEAALEPHCS